MSFDLQAKVWNIDFIKPASHSMFSYVWLIEQTRPASVGLASPLYLKTLDYPWVQCAQR